MFSKIVVGSITALLLSLSIPARVVFTYDSNYVQEIEKEFDFKPGGSFSLVDFKGQIEISGWSENRVEIDVEKSVTASADPGKVREWLEMVEVEIIRQGNEIRVITRGDDKAPVEVAYWIRIPRQTDIEVKSMQSYVMLENLEGHIEVSVVDGSLLLLELKGELEVRIANGPMLLEGCEGSLTTRTVNGSIEARLSGLYSGKLSSVNGPVRLMLPPTADMDLEVSTLTGEIQVDPRLKIDSESGKRILRCSLNKGGKPLEVSNVNGQILIGVL